MPRYIIEAADKETGTVNSYERTAPTRAEAERAMQAEGFLVSRVDLAPGETEPPRDPIDWNKFEWYATRAVRRGALAAVGVLFILVGTMMMLFASPIGSEAAVAGAVQVVFGVVLVLANQPRR